MLKKLSILYLLPLLMYSCSQQLSTQDQAPKPPKGYPNEALLKAAYVTGMLDLIELKPAVPADISVFKDIVYKEVDDISLKLDIYKRQDLAEKVPVLVFIHGGSWTKGNKSDYLPYLISYAQKGYVTATVSYRFSQVAPFPAALEDVKCAVAWIYAHAEEYGILADKIGIVGGSAGGHLAMMLGYSENDEYISECTDSLNRKVQAIVNFYGPADLTTIEGQENSDVNAFVGVSYEESPEAWLEASPRSHISADDPPTITFQGTLDELVPYSQADSLHLWLNRVGVVNEYHKLKGWPHTMDAAKKVNEYCQYYMDAFFKKHLRE